MWNRYTFLMRQVMYLTGSLMAAAVLASAQSPATVPAETLLPRAVLSALDEELSGVAAKDHVARLAQFHRVPASPGFHDAIEYVRGRAAAIGLSDVHVETFPGDGTTAKVLRRPRASRCPQRIRSWSSRHQALI